MALTGLWQSNAISNYQTARKWGTGINPIHSVRGGDGRNTAPGMTEDSIPQEMTDPYAPESLGYTPEDQTSQLWGYGVDTGLVDRARYGEDEGSRDAVLAGYPDWGQYKNGIPGGTGIRSENKGADVTSTAKQIPDEDALQGMVMKETTYVNDPVVSDDSQLFMQTSMTQLTKVRAGSQTPMGRANEFNAPIESRVPGMQKPSYSGEDRHIDMQPKAQDEIIRPFWNRTAGTGPIPWMRTNALYQSQPLQRTPPSEPYSGPEVPAVGSEYGYADEDVIY